MMGKSSENNNYLYGGTATDTDTEVWPRNIHIRHTETMTIRTKHETGREPYAVRPSKSTHFLLLVAYYGFVTVFFLPSVTCFPQESVGWMQQTAMQRTSMAKQIIPFRSRFEKSLTRLKMALIGDDGGDDNNNNSNNNKDDSGDNNNNSRNNNNYLNRSERRRLGRKEARKQSGRGFGRGANTTTALLDAPSRHTNDGGFFDREQELLKRLTQLEHLVAKQTVQIRHLQEECNNLKEASSAFAHVLEMLRAAGLDTDKLPPPPSSSSSSSSSSPKESLAARAKQREQEKYDKPSPSTSNDSKNNDNDDNDDEDTEKSGYEYFDDTEIFGEAPSSVTDAADAAGAAILAGILGGKKRMLVDVRDSELSRDPETLVQFIELAILPVAAGLEGLKSNRNRVKIVFPTVSQLLEYRRTMALCAPEVVSLSTLGFDPVEERDNIVVIVAPPPDNEEGLQAMNELLDPPEWKKGEQISQPVVVLNHHMVPLTGPAANFDVMYHLRLLSVQYMSGDRADSIFEKFDESSAADLSGDSRPEANATKIDTEKLNDTLLEAAMKHAQEAGVNHGVTRAMVIRAYPKPWHVFVDISPASDADFVVAATFDEEPTIEEVNLSIVECLEGSEREDEIVAQQMQEALDMKNNKLDLLDQQDKDKADEEEQDDDDDDDNFDDFYDLWNEDSI